MSRRAPSSKAARCSSNAHATESTSGSIAPAMQLFGPSSAFVRTERHTDARDVCVARGGARVQGRRRLFPPPRLGDSSVPARRLRRRRSRPFAAERGDPSNARGLRTRVLLVRLVQEERQVESYARPTTRRLQCGPLRRRLGGPRCTKIVHGPARYRARSAAMPRPLASSYRRTSRAQEQLTSPSR